MRRILALTALAAVASGCSTASTRTPVLGARADVATLAGEWHGDYSGPAGRNGGISFTLRAADTAAVGEVVMSPDPGQGPAGSNMPADRMERMRLAPRLSVTFIGAAGDRVAGELEAYEDPECRCTVSTAFDGVLRGRVIEGEYRTHGADLGAPRVGRWRVERTAGRL